MAMQQGIQRGSLTVYEGDQVYHFGENLKSKERISTPSAVIKVQSPDFWTRVYTGHDVGCKLQSPMQTPAKVLILIVSF